MARLNVTVAATAATVAAMALLAACGGTSVNADRGAKAADALAALEPAPSSLRLASPVLTDGAALPLRFTCDSTGTSPALAISGVPDGAEELAIVMDDPDATGGTYVHWIVFDLAPADATIAESYLPPDAHLARNSAGRADYAAPCPPEGDAPHPYRISVYALGEATPDSLRNAIATDALEAIAERATARATLTATYQRSR